MARVAIVGGGIGGLATGLFCARRGHEAVIVERDHDSPRGDADVDFETWRRPGVPHARQPHNFLGLARRVLDQEAPDVLAAVLSDEPTVIAVSQLLAADPDPGDAELTLFAARRVGFEAHLRAATEAETSVTLITGAAAEGLLVDGERVDGAPHIVGVRTADDAIVADVVVDAAGRRSPLPAWLEEVDGRPPVDESQDLRFAYHTRWYRYPPGAVPPPAMWPPFVDLGYGAVIVFPADRRVVGIAITLHIRDDLRARLRDPELFDRVAAELPTARACFEAGALPITDVLLMARLENRSRRLVDDRGPIATGVVALGDAALYTNPTLGRGASLALAHAQRLAEVVEADPMDLAVGFDEWTQANLGPWFATQVAVDGGRLAVMEATMRNEVPPSDGTARFVEALTECAQHDRVVARSLARFSLLLDHPSVMLADPEVQRRVVIEMERLGDTQRVTPLPRARFEELLD